jgi:ATP-dependent DNA helicase RecQ
MGIDIPDIRYVINYSIPSCIEDFAQQSGRCSRDGKYAQAIVLFDYKDVNTAYYLIDSLSSPSLNESEIKKIKRENRSKLESMIEFSYTRGCLHKFVCNYFKEKHLGNCMMCSNCKKS